MSASLIEGTANQIDLELFDLVIEVRSTRQVNAPGGSFARRQHLARGSRVTHFGPAAIDRHLITGGYNYRSLDNVFQLADIPRIIVIFQERKDLGRDRLGHFTAVLLGILRDEMLCEWEYVLTPVPQRREL